MSHWQNAIAKVLSLSAEYELLLERDPLVIGVSGGPDSVLLTHILAELTASKGFPCHLAHVNYKLRGVDSDADEALVRELAQSKGWTCDVHWPPRAPPAAAPQGSVPKRNFQAWAREERYRFFAEVARRQGATKIAVAHHLTDQVETVLQRMLRGSSLRGLAAMRPTTVRDGLTVIRPLLRLTKQEILAALEEKGQSYREDRSNQTPHYQRNRLRHEVLPILQDCQPGFEPQVGESLLVLQADEDFLEACGRDKFQELKLPAAGGLELARGRFCALPKSLRLRVLRRAIVELTGSRQSITFHHVTTMDALACSGPARAHYDLPGRLLFETGPKAVVLRAKP